MRPRVQMHRHTPSSALVLALVLSASAAGQEPVRTLEPGDAVRIQVWRQPELSGEFPLNEQGAILHPLYRSIDAAGVDFETVESRIEALLRRYESQPEFVIQPLLRVSVTGEVRQPSLYRLPPTTTIAEAIAGAGGVTEEGDLEGVRVFRDGREIEVDLTRVDAAAGGLAIRSGDQIFVERRVSVLRDYIAPAAGIVAAAVTILNIIISN